MGDVIASLKNAGVSANFDETTHRIFVSSKETGKDNDFTLTGSNLDGASALYRLGLNAGESDATKDTYASYTKYYGDGTQISTTVDTKVGEYKTAKANYDKGGRTKFKSYFYIRICDSIYCNAGCVKEQWTDTTGTGKIKNTAWHECNAESEFCDRFIW